MRLFVLLLLLYASAVFLLPLAAAVETETALEEELKAQLYKKCWQECQEKHNSTSEEAVLALINDQFDLPKHHEHCLQYNASRNCAYSCLTDPNHDYFLRPFHRRNYLNEFICVKHYNEFRTYLPCYRNHHSLEHFFIKCGYFALDDQTVLQATKETCAALRCVTRYIPGLIRQECASGEQELAKGAGDLMERMVTAFLRERVRLHKMRRLCEGTTI